MILAQFHNKTVRIEDAKNGYALIRTMDDSKPFLTRIAHSDPEEYPSPEFIYTDWAWVDGKDLIDITQTAPASASCPHEHVIINTSGGWKFSPEIGPYDDIKEYLLCLDCMEEVTLPEPEPITDETEEILF
jgi:hypothetical protein